MTNNKQQTTNDKNTILVVDDNPINLRLLVDYLSEVGFEILAAEDGEAALELLQYTQPDIILLDVMMPVLDGFETCRRLKDKPETKDIPGIFMTALSQTTDKVKGFQAGAVDYITKPFQQEEVLARLKTHLALRNMQKQLQQMNEKLSETNDALWEANSALSQANASLEASNQELDAFAHTVAHDLKNPLGVIMGAGEILASDIIPPKESNWYLHNIVEATYKMNNIIESLLLLAGVRKAKVIPKSLDMGKIVMNAQQTLADIIEEYQAQIDLPSYWPAAVGYAPWIEEVWVNYLSNAIKYGGRPPRLQLGAAPLSISSPTGEDKGGVQFWVQDNGPGLSPEEQAQLFMPFIRLSKLRIEGHGLGLSIVRRIVEKLGGQVGLESEVGQGCKFSFTLPAQTKLRKKCTPLQPPPESGGRL